MKSQHKRIFYYILLSVTLIVCIAPFASNLPDGLEWVAHTQGFSEKAREFALHSKLSPMPDYKISFLAHQTTSTLFCGIAGLILTLVLSALFFRIIKKENV